MQEFLQYLFSGITSGAIYAIIAVGYSMLYNSTELINFAQGEFVMIGGMSFMTLWGVFKLPLPLAIALSVAVTALCGLVFERFAIRTAKKDSHVVLIIITVGASIFIRGAAMILWGKEPHSLPQFSDIPPFNIAGAFMVFQSVWIIAAAIIIAVALDLFYRRSLTGKAMTACAISMKAASLTGIPAGFMVLLAFLISSSTGAVAGAMIGPVTMCSYDMGTVLGLKGFCSAMLGGLGSLWGSIAGGLLLGVLESMGAGYISSGVKDAIAFLSLLLILYLRPGGLFGKKEIKRF